ncbi:MAG: TonB C-terminal domain-containing protein [Candidatus Protistobacter heckmanni]|nr:TonB C-terminal domain-containing protein [Candidatus Protistobacter heckmanni]
MKQEKREQQLKAQQAAQAKLNDKACADELARLRGLASDPGKNGGSGSYVGSAIGNGGPDMAGYADKVKCRVIPNIIGYDAAPGSNPAATVQVDLAPNGDVMGRKIIKSSGDPNWDNVVLRALDRSSPLPRNDDGKVPSSFNIIFRPRDN